MLLDAIVVVCNVVYWVCLLLTEAVSLRVESSTVNLRLGISGLGMCRANGGTLATV